MTVPLVVDHMDDRVGHLYSGMPDRLYVIGRDGRIVYKSGRGPFGFIPAEMEQALILHLLDQTGERRYRASLRLMGSGGAVCPRCLSSLVTAFFPRPIPSKGGLRYRSAPRVTDYLARR